MAPIQATPAHYGRDQKVVLLSATRSFFAPKWCDAKSFSKSQKPDHASPRVICHYLRTKEELIWEITQENEGVISLEVGNIFDDVKSRIRVTLKEMHKALLGCVESMSHLFNQPEAPKNL